jgi:RNA recognition motif-containing protein
MVDDFISHYSRATTDSMTNSLFVGNLPYDLTNEELRDTFASFGAISNVNIATERYYGNLRSRGFGFVDFTDAASLKRVTEHTDQFVLKGRTLTVREARPQGQISDTALVANLTESVTNTSLAAHFARFNPIEAKVVHAGNAGKPGFGYAKFANEQQRDAAIRALNGTVLDGAAISVRTATRAFRTDEEQHDYRESRRPRW